MCAKKRCYLCGKEVQDNKAMDLLLAKKIRWNDRLVAGTIQKTTQPSKPTHSGRTDTHCQHEEKKSRYRVSGLLGEVKRKRIYPYSPRTLSSDAEVRVLR